MDIEAEYFDRNARGRATLIGDGLVPRSALYVPLISHDAVIGVMQVQHYDTKAFQDADLTFVSILPIRPPLPAKMPGYTPPFSSTPGGSNSQ